MQRRRGQGKFEGAGSNQSPLQLGPTIDWSNSGGMVTCRWDRSFSAGFIEESAQASCALLVLKEAESTKDGVWLKVKCLGCKDKDFQKTGKSEDAPVLWRNDQLPHDRRTWMPYRQVPLVSSW